MTSSSLVIDRKDCSANQTFCSLVIGYQKRGLITHQAECFGYRLLCTDSNKGGIGVNSCDTQII